MEAAQSSQSPIVRPGALAVLLLLEFLALNFSFDSYQAHLLNSGLWFEALAHAGQISKALVAVPVFLLLSLWPRLPGHFERLQQAATDYPWRYLLLLHLACYALLFWLSFRVFGPQTDVAAVSGTLALGWLIAGFATAGLWLLCLAPWSFWLRFLRAEVRIVLSAMLIGVLAWLLAAYAQTFWTPLSDATFHLSSTLLSLFYPEVFVDAATRRLGAENFIVNIAPQCSGYEGMGLMLAFTGFYLSIYRRDFRFPHALLLIPLGVAVIWLFNNLRIAVLVGIGISFSPAVAVGGFHSQAGWISFIAVIVLTLAAAYRVPFFQPESGPRSGAGGGINLPMATLLPFVVLLAATILTAALAADFDWFYPLRVLAVALAIGVCWPLYGLTQFRPRLEAWLAGAVVFVVWILLVPNDAAADSSFARVLAETSPAIAFAWLAMRTIGAVVTVPIAEELVFRGYLLARLARASLALEGRIEFAWLPFLASSILFGLLHSHWIAGIAAGLVYGLLRYRGRSIVDAIAAHAFTNLLLSIYVISTAQWSLW